MSQTGTHPVYVDRGLKKNVEEASVAEDTTMKEIMERLIVRGMEEGFHETPLPKSFSDRLDTLHDDMRSASKGYDPSRLQDRLDQVRTDIESADLRNDEEVDKLLERCDELESRIAEQAE